VPNSKNVTRNVGRYFHTKLKRFDSTKSGASEINSGINIYQGKDRGSPFWNCGV